MSIRRQMPRRVVAYEPGKVGCVERWKRPEGRGNSRASEISPEIVPVTNAFSFDVDCRKP